MRPVPGGRDAAGGHGRLRGRHVLVPAALCVLLFAVTAPGAAAGGAVAGRARASATPSRSAAAPFTATELPLPPGGLVDHSAYAGPIACPKVGECVVLGEYPTSSGISEDFIATESGRSWSALRAPLPRGGVEAANLGPFTLGCTGVGDCVGTSLYVTASAVLPDLLVESKGHWSASAMPLPSNADTTRLPTIAALSCPDLGHCVIVGDYVVRTGASEAFVVTEKASGFAVAEAPLPGRANRAAALSGVGCSTAGACIAAGYVVNSAGVREPLVVSDTAGSLRAVAVTLPAGASGKPQAELDAVSCGHEAACVALGSYLGPKSGRLGVIETDSKGRWSTARMPAPSGANGTNPAPQIGGVVCKVGNYCMAVGRYTDATGKQQGLALLEESGRWSAATLPGTLDKGPVVSAVSCVSDTSCAAVGHYTPATGRSGYLVLRSGEALSGETAPQPENASQTPDEQLGFVACPWVATCTATGTYESSADPGITLPLVVGN